MSLDIAGSEALSRPDIFLGPVMLVPRLCFGNYPEHSSHSGLLAV